VLSEWSNFHSNQGKNTRRRGAYIKYVGTETIYNDELD